MTTEEQQEDAVCFLLGNSTASEFYMPTFRDAVSSIFIGGEVWSVTAVVKVFKPKVSLYNYYNFLNPSHTSHLPAYEDGTECSETSAYKIQTPGNCPEESIQHSEQVEGSEIENTPSNFSILFLKKGHENYTSFRPRKTWIRHWPPVWNFTEILPVDTKYIRADAWTDIAKLIGDFRCLTRAPKKHWPALNFAICYTGQRHSWALLLCFRAS